MERTQRQIDSLNGGARSIGALAIRLLGVPAAVLLNLLLIIGLISVLGIVEIPRAAGAAS